MKIKKIHNSIYWVISFLLLLAGIFLESEFEITRTFSSFFISTSWNEVFTAMSGISSTATIFIAYFGYKNWLKNKDRHYLDDQILSIRANLLSWLNLKDFYKDELEEKTEISLALDIFKEIAIVSNYIPQNYKDKTIDIMTRLLSLHSKKESVNKKTDAEEENDLKAMSEEIILLTSNMRKSIKHNSII